MIENTNLKQLLDLSVVELLILQYMQRTQNPIIKLQLLEEINLILGPEKNLSPSSFYLKLEKLTKKSLIVEQKGKGKRMPVQVTPFAAEALNQVNNIIMSAKLDIFELMQQTVGKMKQNIDIDRSGSLLIINFEDKIDKRKVDLIFSLVEHGYLLSDDDLYSKLQKRIPNLDFSQTRFLKGKIREAENYFDAVVIIGFGLQYKLNGYDGNSWLKEAFRVLKEQGTLIVLSVLEIPTTGHFIADSLLNEFKNNPILNPITKKEFHQQLASIPLENLKIFEESCIMIGIGNK